MVVVVGLLVSVVLVHWCIHERLMCRLFVSGPVWLVWVMQWCNMWLVSGLAVGGKYHVGAVAL